MNCQDFVERMQDRLDNRLPLDGDRELVEHARGCAPCSADLKAWQSIESVMGPTVTKPAPELQTTGRLPHYRVASIAASALLAFGLLSWSQSKTDQQLVSVETNRPAIPAPVMVEPDGDKPAGVAPIVTAPIVTAPVVTAPMAVESIASAPVAAPPMIAAPVSPLAVSSTAIESNGGVSNPGELELSEESVEWWKSVGQGEWLAQSMPTVLSMREGAAPFRRSLMQIVSLLTFGRPDSIVLPEPVSVRKATVESRQTS